MGKFAFTLLLRRPIAYQPVCADIMGNVAGGVILSQLLYWASTCLDEESGLALFWKTDAELIIETRCSRWELQNAKSQLRNLPFVQVERQGIPARTWYRFDLGRFAQYLQEQAHLLDKSKATEDELDSTGTEPTGPNSKQQMRGSASKFAGNLQTSLQETCKLSTETTSENVQSSTDCASAIAQTLQPTLGTDAAQGTKKQKGSPTLYQQVAELMERVVGERSPPPEVRSCLRYVKECLAGDAGLTLEQIEQVWHLCRQGAAEPGKVSLRWVITNWTMAKAIAGRRQRPAETNTRKRGYNPGGLCGCLRAPSAEPQERERLRTVGLHGIAEIKQVLRTLAANQPIAR